MTTPEHNKPAPTPDNSLQGEPDFVAINTTDGEVDAMKGPDDQPSKVKGDNANVDKA